MASIDMQTTSKWEILADKVLRNISPSKEEALSLLKAHSDETLSILHAAYRVRRHFHGNKVRVHMLQNARSGACSEDCGYCSQSAKYQTPAPEFPLVTVESMVEGARRAKTAGAWNYCIVTSGRSPADRDLDVICGAVKRIRSEICIRVCTSLGLLTGEKAKRLAEAGVNRYNHNLETSRRLYSRIVSTHTYEDRVNTARFVKEAGMELCCGGIIGLGEDCEDVIDLCFAARDLGACAVPVNFLDPRQGTPLENRERLEADYALRVLCLFRFVHPDVDVRCAGGREITFRSLQPLVLYAANSIFTNGYLTTPGQGQDADFRMIKDLGMEAEVESAD